MADGYDPLDWYWTVVDTTSVTHVYSSSSSAFLPVANSVYTAWLARGNAPTLIDTVVNLQRVIGTVSFTLFRNASQTISSLPTTLTNPLTNKVIVSTTGNLTLPAMNTPISIPVGEWLEIENSHATGEVVVKDNVGSTLLTLKAGDRAKLTLTSNATAAGSFSYSFTRKVGATSDVVSLISDFHRCDGRLTTLGVDVFDGTDYALQARMFLGLLRGDKIALRKANGEWVTRVFNRSMATLFLDTSQTSGFTGDITNSQPTITDLKNAGNGITGAAQLHSLCIGMQVTGTGIPASTTVVAVDIPNRQVTLSANTTSSIGDLSVTFKTPPAMMMDVFAFPTGTDEMDVRLEQVKWTSTSVRTVALARQDGVYVKDGDTTRRYMGSYYSESAGRTNETSKKRHVWSYYGRHRRVLRAKEQGVASWTYNSTTWRSSSGASNALIEIVSGIPEQEIRVIHKHYASGPAVASHGYGGIGKNGSAVGNLVDESIQIHPVATAGWLHNFVSTYAEVPAVGFTHYYGMERTDGGGNWTFFGQTNQWLTAEWDC